MAYSNVLSTASLSSGGTKVACYCKAMDPLEVEFMTLYESEVFEAWGFRPAKSYELANRQQILALRDFLNSLYPPM